MEHACFAGPEINEEEQFSIDEDGVLRMSTVTAYYRFDDLEEFLKQQFPSLEFFWFTTDEFGNFHEIHDPDNLGEFCPFYLDSDEDSSYYYQHEYEEFLTDFRNECPGLEMPDDRTYLSSEVFIDDFLKWRNSDRQEKTHPSISQKKSNKTQIKKSWELKKSAITKEGIARSSKTESS